MFSAKFPAKMSDLLFIGTSSEEHHLMLNICNFTSMHFLFFGKSVKGKYGTAGKNAHAMSVLQRIEMKLDGRDISDKRYLHPL